LQVAKTARYTLKRGLINEQSSKHLVQYSQFFNIYTFIGMAQCQPLINADIPSALTRQAIGSHSNNNTRNANTSSSSLYAANEAFHRSVLHHPLLRPFALHVLVSPVGHAQPLKPPKRAQAHQPEARRGHNSEYNIVDLISKGFALENRIGNDYVF
jgi:hypothetical protein